MGKEEQRRERAQIARATIKLNTFVALAIVSVGIAGWIVLLLL